MTHDLENVENILLTTETGSDLKVLKRIEIVTGECAFGARYYRKVFDGTIDVYDTRPTQIEGELKEARKRALLDLKREACDVGANAVIGVRFSYSEVSGPSSAYMLFLVVSGTAVEISQS